MLHWGNIAALGLLACSGKLAVLSEPVENADGSDPSGVVRAPGSDSPGPDPTASDPTAADPAVSSPAGTGSTSPAPTLPSTTVTLPLDNCPELTIAPFPSHDSYEPLIDCGVCTCEGVRPPLPGLEADGFSCSSRECATLRTIGRCSDGSPSTPEAMTALATIRGDTMTLHVKGYGGCRDQDFIPCYVPPALSSFESQSRYPRRATLRVLNPTSPGDCNKVSFQTLQLGLQTLREFQSAEGGLVETNFGTLQLGELTCQDAPLLARDQFTQALQLLSASGDALSCQSDADCITTGHWPSCSDCSYYTTNQSHYAQASAALERIEAEICAPLAASCAEAFGTLTRCPEGIPTACQEGRCVQTN